MVNVDTSQIPLTRSSLFNSTTLSIQVSSAPIWWRTNFLSVSGINFTHGSYSSLALQTTICTPLSFLLLLLLFCFQSRCLEFESPNRNVRKLYIYAQYILYKHPICFQACVQNNRIQENDMQKLDCLLDRSHFQNYYHFKAL